MDDKDDVISNNKRSRIEVIEPLFKTDKRVKKLDYFVKKSFLNHQDIENVKLSLIMKHRNKFVSVIQSSDTTQQDNKRLMLENLSEQQVKKFGLSDIDNKVSLLCNEEFDGLKKSNITLLLSLKGCKEQQKHFDYDPNDERSSMFKILIVAIMDNTNILVWNTRGYDRRIITIPKGSVFIGKGTLLHAGSPYIEDNVRLFYSVDEKRRVEFTTTYLMYRSYLLFYEKQSINAKNMNKRKKEKKMELEKGKEERKEKMKHLSNIKYCYLKE